MPPTETSMTWLPLLREPFAQRTSAQTTWDLQTGNSIRSTVPIIPIAAGRGTDLLVRDDALLARRDHADDVAVADALA